MQFSDFSMSEVLPDFECEGLEQSLGRPLTSNRDVVCLSVLFFFFHRRECKWCLECGGVSEVGELGCQRVKVK